MNVVNSLALGDSQLRRDGHHLVRNLKWFADSKDEPMRPSKEADAPRQNDNVLRQQLV